MRMTLLAGALAAAGLAAPAAAVTITSVTGNGEMPFSNAAAGLLQADFRLKPGQSVTLGLVVETGDSGGIAFDSVVDLPGLFGTNGLVITLSDGAFFSLIGSLVPGFATATIGGSASDVTISFTPREFVGVFIGDIAFGGTDWVINPGPAGILLDSFTLTIAAVPAPAALALFGLGVLGLVARRRG